MKTSTETKQKTKQNRKKEQMQIGSKKTNKTENTHKYKQVQADTDRYTRQTNITTQIGKGRNTEGNKTTVCRSDGAPQATARHSRTWHEPRLVPWPRPLLRGPPCLGNAPPSMENQGCKYVINYGVLCCV